MSLALWLIAHGTEDEGRKGGKGGKGACQPGHTGGMMLEVGEKVGEAGEYPGEGRRGRRGIVYTVHTIMISQGQENCHNFYCILIWAFKIAMILKEETALASIHSLVLKV